MRTPNINRIELCLTYKCNVYCDNCSGLCTQAPAGEELDMTVDQVKDFIAQSIELNWPWERITLHGGEPTLHPNFKEICEIVADYKKNHNENCGVWFCTNYASPKSHDFCEEIKMLYGIGAGISEKHGGANVPYVATNMSPTDCGEAWERGCLITEDCGICLNHAGYFECSPAAAASRVFDRKPFATKLKDVTAGGLASCFETDCAHCGWSVPGRARITEQQTSKTWKEALDKYEANHVQVVIPDFARDSLEGQLTQKERRLLYAAIICNRPRIALEIGTWNGGGSTYFISSAMNNVGKGSLHTVEANKEQYDHAVALYTSGL